MLAGYQEAKIKQKIVEYTLEEIADKLGIDVKYIRIKN
jgi:DNA-directed RNA polymerase specialized sigma24 family protein